LVRRSLKEIKDFLNCPRSLMKRKGRNNLGLRKEKARRSL